jgi:ketosteroid isomerase-like protein
MAGQHRHGEQGESGFAQQRGGGPRDAGRIRPANTLRQCAPSGDHHRGDQNPAVRCLTFQQRADNAEQDGHARHGDRDYGRFGVRHPAHDRDRSPTAARQLASRARRRVHGVGSVPDADLHRQRRVVDAFLAASRGGDFDALVALLDPDVVLRADREVGPTPAPIVLRGVRNVSKGAFLASERARSTQPALINGTAGLVLAPRGRLFLVLTFTVADGKITEIDVIADPDRLRRLDLAVLGD